MTFLKALFGERLAAFSIATRSSASGVAPIALIAVGLLACGDDSASGGTANSGGAGHSSGVLSGGSGGAMSTTGGAFSNGAGGTNSSGTSTASMGVGGGCAGTSVEAQKIPLDMYVMLDQSGSMNDQVMGGTKWSAVTGALDSFVTQPQAAGLGMGIQFFGYLTGGQSSSCNASDYANPMINGGVEIAVLPGVAGAITAAIGAHSPTTKTPTSAALQGAVDHAKAWQIANPTHVVVAVLATDGDPTECDTNLNHIDAIAAAALTGTPPIKTFVIGIGSSTANLNGIAAAGGTTQAFIVDTTMNTNAQFLAALNAIQGTSLPCNYTIPPPPMGMTLDFTSLNVQYIPGDGSPPVIIPNVANAAACPATGDAWYYDNPAAPTQVILCSGTCATVGADTMGKVNVVLGCQTMMGPPPN